jgi:hypothetical protein
MFEWMDCGESGESEELTPSDPDARLTGITARWPEPHEADGLNVSMDDDAGQAWPAWFIPILEKEDAERERAGT